MAPFKTLELEFLRLQEFTDVVWVQLLIMTFSAFLAIAVIEILPAVQLSIDCKWVGLECQSGAAFLFVFLRARAVWLVHVRVDHETGGFIRAEALKYG